MVPKEQLGIFGSVYEQRFHFPHSYKTSATKLKEPFSSRDQKGLRKQSSDEN